MHAEVVAEDHSCAFVIMMGSIVEDICSAEERVPSLDLSRVRREPHRQQTADSRRSTMVLGR